MKKIVASIIFLCSTNCSQAQQIEGSWLGELAAGGAKLHLGLNIAKAPDGTYSTTFDSPDQKVFGIKCSKTTITGDSLSVEMAMINGSYKGRWDKKDGITGTYRQSGREFPLDLGRITKKPVEEKIRPQTPKPPFDYVSEDVEYDNTDKSLHYGATFTRPKGDGKYPAVIIISGSGTQDRDGTLFGHKLYWVLADHLTKNGIAVLRVDDRGAGKSTLGDISKATSLDFSYDVEASLNYLETRVDVNKKHIGLIGHSEGGIIAPMVAARRKDINFLVLWAGPAIGGAQTNVEQNMYALRKAGIDSASTAAFGVLHAKILGLFTTAASRDELDKQLIPIYEDWKKLQSQKTLDALYVQGNMIVGKDILTIYHGLYDLPWMRYFISYIPETDLSKVKCAVLAINGTKDTQVDATSNLAKVREVLTKNGNKNFEVKALPNLNHLLQTGITGDLAEYEKIDETISPDALNIISDWIKLHTK